MITPSLSKLITEIYCNYVERKLKAAELKRKHIKICVVSETIKVLGDTKSNHEFE